MDTVVAIAKWEVVLTGRPARTEPARRLTGGLQIPRLRVNAQSKQVGKDFS